LVAIKNIIENDKILISNISIFYIYSMWA
jgi:hypothetical protein